MIDQKFKMLEACKISLLHGCAVNLTDVEIDMCMAYKVASQTLARYAKQFRDEGLLTLMPPLPTITTS